MPRNVSQKCHRPSRSFMNRPNIFGNQKYVPAKMPNSDAEAMTKWKCATTKNVSVTYTSIGGEPRKIPVRPPVTNSETKPIAKSIGVLNRSFPRHSVASQLNVFTAEGTE